MMGWEYCKIEVLSDLPRLKFMAQLIFIGSGDTEMDINIGQAIKKLGLDGWEMISFQKIYHPKRDDFSEEFYIFKRSAK